jgi:hypothetical protein
MPQVPSPSASQARMRPPRADPLGTALADHKIASFLLQENILCDVSRSNNVEKVDEAPTLCPPRTKEAAVQCRPIPSRRGQQPRITASNANCAGERSDLTRSLWDGPLLAKDLRGSPSTSRHGTLRSRYKPSPYAQPSKLPLWVRFLSAMPGAMYCRWFVRFGLVRSPTITSPCT